MKTIKKEVSFEIIVKKSKFIANVFPVQSKEEAEQKINEISKRYFDARHNCYGYILEDFEKCSDDGEPSKTAGAPILDIIKKKELKNVLIIVTRYFGGILLGTGGLVRAYSETAKKAIDRAEIVNQIKGIEYEIRIKYDDQKNVLYWCKLLNIKVINVKYMNYVELKLQSSKEDMEKLLNNTKIAENFKILNENIYIVEENL